MKPNPYIPIDCSYYDRLEANAVKKVICEIVYRSTNDAPDIQQQAVITNVFSRNKEEFISLSTGEEIRLDRLMSVNGIPNPSFSCASRQE